MTRVRLTLTAERHLAEIRSWVAAEADPVTADRIAGDLLSRCLSLCQFPRRGTLHDAIRPGMRTIPFKKRYTIGYVVVGEDVLILGIAGAGQDWDDVFDASS